jgi:hypothetical protein
MLQALFVNEVSNLLPGVLRPQRPLVPFLRFFQYGIDEITRPKGFSGLLLCLFPSRPLSIDIVEKNIPLVGPPHHYMMQGSRRV